MKEVQNTEQKVEKRTERKNILKWNWVLKNCSEFIKKKYITRPLIAKISHPFQVGLTKYVLFQIFRSVMFAVSEGEDDS